MAVVRIDTGDLRALAYDLGQASGQASKLVRETTQRAALNIKRDLQGEAESSPSFRRVPVSITYETRETRDGITAEIGPEIGKPGTQGSLAWIPYEGTATMGPLFPDPAGALERESDVYARYLADAVADGLL